MDTYGGYANGIPRNCSVLPLVKPENVASSRRTVGAGARKGIIGVARDATA